MKKVVLLWGILLMGAIVFSCAPKVTTTEKPVSTVEEPKAIVKESWQVEWEKTLGLAKKEGKIFVYGTANVREAFIPFTNKFGIDVEMIIGRGAEISTRLASERRAGIYTADVYQGGVTTLITAIKPAQTLDPIDKVLILPEVLYEGQWLNKRIPFIDEEKMVLAFIAGISPRYVINTQMVKPDELKSYLDVLEPKWKGKIILNDPTAGGGAGLLWFGFVVREVLGLEKGIEYMKNLLRQEPMLTRDQRLQVDWVARGKYAIAIAPQREMVDAFVQLEAPIKHVELFDIQLVTPGSGGLALIKRAPRPNAARVFINWLLTREGQTYYYKALGSPSARLDVPTEGLMPSVIPDHALKTFIPSEAFYLGQSEMADLAREIFGPLLR